MTRIKDTDTQNECVVEYSTLHATLGNTPYAVMLLLGAAIIGLAFRAHPWAWPLAVGFVLYGVAGTLWIIAALCPHCPSYGQTSCPCGYGVVSARLRPKGDADHFTRKFRQTIPAIVPLWFAPVIIATVAFIKSFDLPLAILAGVFVLDAYVLLPWLSRGHGCKHCPQRDLCPWWTSEAAGQTASKQTYESAPDHQRRRVTAPEELLSVAAETRTAASDPGTSSD